MRKNLLVIALAIFASACGGFAVSKDAGGAAKADEKAAATAPARSAESGKPVVGDTVVARWSGNSFYEGKVEEVDGRRFKIKWNDNSSTSQVDAVDVYALPKEGAKAEVKAGDYVLAKTSSGTNWAGAEVTGVSDGVVTVKTAYGANTANLPPEKVIKISPATAANFKQQAGQTDFLTRAQTGRPKAPSGYVPKKGDRVVAEWTTNGWYGGRVQKVSGDRATVVWDDNGKPSDLTLDKVVPYPTASNYAAPAAGDYLIVKPGGSGRWGFAQVAAAGGASIEVKTAEGQTRSIRSGEYVIIK